ncbi:MAG TPA: LuxR C-terminal-related transcriptional regulator [Propionicimonas sp.]|jgi:DNA-binding CsgD family transcriptional regulator
MVTATEQEPITADALPALTTWSDLCQLVGDLPYWVPRIALAESVCRELLILAEESTGSTCVPGGCRALLTTLDRVGFFQERDPASTPGRYVLHPEVRRLMLAELERDDPGLANIRRELVQTGIRLVPVGVGAQLANWAFESRDWQSLEALWITYSPAELLSNPRARSAYVEASAEQRSRLPGLSFASGLASAFDPASGELDLDLLIATLIRDGRTLHAKWHDKGPVDAKVAAGTLWMLAQATIPESLEDPMLDGAMATYLELTRVIRESAISGNTVSGRSLTFFHATASLMAFMRADWARARRESELGMILTESCGFAGFLAAAVVGSSSSASGNTQYATMSEKYLARHAAHNCPVIGWIEPAMHLCWADAATRRLDRERTRHHLKLHELEGAATHWFNIQPMNARILSTAAIIWSDPEQALAQFDSIVSDAGFEPTLDTPWGPLLLRSRAELLVNMGALSKAEPLVDQLLHHGDASVSAVPAARFALCSSDFDGAVAKADEGIFSLQLSLADRAHLYALKAAALLLGGAQSDQVGRAAAAACVVCEQADTLVPFAMLPSGARTILVSDHRRHHGSDECFVAAAGARGAFADLQACGATVPVVVKLTRREEVLLPLLATSATVQEIADQQFVSVNTVRKQVVSMREKLGVGSRGELIRRAHELGLLSVPTRPAAQS